MDDALMLRNLARDNSLAGPVVTTLEMMEGGLEATAIEVDRIMTAILREETPAVDSEQAAKAQSLDHMAISTSAQ